VTDPPASAPGPLDGVRVVDFTEYIAGPYATMMLADMGADVVKVEPVKGDHWRHQSPIAPNESRIFLSVNRGKRSVALDLWSERGQALGRQLAAGADVVTVNYRPGVARELRLDFDSVRASNPTVVHADITAFGRSGPYSHRGGFDLLSQAAAGVMAFEARVQHGTPSGVQSFAPADLTTGMFTAFAIVNALYRRLATGHGQRVSTNLFHSALAMQYRPLVSVEREDATGRASLLALIDDARASGASYEEILELRQVAGGKSVSNYYRVYQTQDGLVAVACLNNRLRRTLRDVAGVHDSSIDESAFRPDAVPLSEHARVQSEMEAALATRTTEAWLALLDEAGVPAAPFNLTEQLYDDPQVVANDLIPTFAHPTLGAIRTPRSPIEMSDSSVGSSQPAPTLGMDTHSVLAELGVSAEEIAELEAAGIAVQWQPGPGSS
jgi:formyl-CoA transferase